MMGEPVLVMLVEDNADHAELVIRTMQDHHIANRIIHFSDGQSALDYLLRRGVYEDPETSPRPHPEVHPAHDQADNSADQDFESARRSAHQRHGQKRQIWQYQPAREPVQQPVQVLVLSGSQRNGKRVGHGFS